MDERIGTKDIGATWELLGRIDEWDGTVYLDMSRWLWLCVDRFVYIHSLNCFGMSVGAEATCRSRLFLSCGLTLEANPAVRAVWEPGR
jgi:hypothetical protein